MANLQLGAVLQQLRRAAARKQEDELSDSQLLERFTQRRDESAFAALLRRHGPMVLGVCRGVLRQLHDVEDAFQATFLILSQKAASIRRTESVGAWLHGVAYKVALKARTRAARVAVGQAFQPDERAMPDRIPTDPLDDLTVRELRQALHEELRQLPEKYRAPLILCYLEGKTQEEAARQLAWPSRRVKDRLQRGREQLRRRLHKRGLAPAVTLGTALFVAEDASAAVPAALAGATVRVALMGNASPALVALVESGVAFVSFNKAKMAVMILLAVSVLSGAGVYFLASPQRQQGQPLPALGAGEQNADTPRPAKRDATTTVEIHGRVLGPDGKPKAGAKLLLLSRDGEVKQLGVTAADGQFSVAVPKEAKDRYLIARTSDTGIAIVWAGGLKPEKPVDLHLVKDQPIRGRVVNTEGKPVAGVRVAANDFNTYGKSLDMFLAFWKNLRVPQNPLYGEYQLRNAASALFATTTDAEGRFVLRGLGEERFISVYLSGAGIADTELWVATRPGFDPKPFNKAVLDNSFKDELELFGNGRQLHGPDVSIVVEAEKILRGVVKDADTGEGRSNVVVHLMRPLGSDLEVRTDAEGRYEIRGVRKAKSYHLQVLSDPATGYMASEVQANDSPGYQPVTADIRVKKGVIVTGKMIDQTTGKTISGLVRINALKDNPFVNKYPAFESAGWNSVQLTDANGVFRIVAIPGPMLLMGGPRGTSAMYKRSIVDPKYRQYFNTTPNYVAYYRKDGGFSPISDVFFTVLEIKADAKIVEQDIVLERLPAMTVQIQDADGKPLTHVLVGGLSTRGAWPTQFAESVCSAYGVQPGKPRLMIFYHPKRRLAATITLKGDEKQPVVVELGPAAAIKGRLLDADGKPLAGVRVDSRYHHLDADTMRRAIYMDKQIETDANGNFTLDEVLPGFMFDLSFRRGRLRFEREAKLGESAIQVKPGECRDLGDIRVKPQR